MDFGFIKTAALSPSLRVADCEYNSEEIIKSLSAAVADGVRLAVFPELCITGYTCGDLFFQQSLLDGARDALIKILRKTSNLSVIALAGLPVRVDGKIYNCAAVFSGGRLLGLVPKTFLPNYAEFYERRQFVPWDGIMRKINFAGQEIPFGANILFKWTGTESFCLGVELCEDLWAPLPPSTGHALAGATVIANLSASDETVSKSEYRRALVAQQSARLLCGYVYSDAGHGESTTDMVFAGNSIIAENGSILAENPPFGKGLSCAHIDTQRLLCDRSRNTTFTPNGACNYITVDFNMDSWEGPLQRYVSPTPFVPESETDRARRCELILTMQADGLAKRLEHANSKTAVIGISGGLDSCLALLVAYRAMKIIEKPASDIIAITMPCFGTTHRTRSNAEILCNELGVTFREIDITATVRSHFNDIGHDEVNTDVTYENAQARIRTLELMDTANQSGGLVVGTGDLSELALGWATYNGDHMSMYGVNAGVPKTLVRHMVRYEADIAKSDELRKVLMDILDTPVSPELLPSDGNDICQRTEDIVGPYELHDFYLYYVLRFGFRPAKILYLAQNAFGKKYDRATLIKWLKNFYRRFFAQQFKRSCLPDGPKIGSVTLSPRGDWRMPSDARADVWLNEVNSL